jgi:signal transduction histidine kinase
VQVPLVVTLRHRVDSEARLRVVSQSAVTAVNAAGAFGSAARPRLRRMVATAAASARTHVFVVNPAGHVIADSAPRARLGRDESRNPDVVRALRGLHTEGTRRDRGRDVIQAAAPVLREGVPVGAVVVAEDVASVRGAVRSAVVVLAVLGGVVLLVGLAAGLVIAGQLTRPLRHLAAAAGRIADGDLEVRAPVEGTAEHRLVANAFNDMTARLARALRSQQDFVADASHELRSPLAGLKLRLEEAREAGMTGDAETMVDGGLREVDRLVHTVNELLVLSRAGERDAPGEALDLVQEATLVADRWSARVRDAGLGLELAASDGPVLAWCAQADLQRAADALVENAVQYSPAGTTLTIGVDGGALEILDEGPGLADDELDEVFKRFRRGRVGKRHFGGSGLGLPIARELARRWGGDATLENRPGGGARAAISLPPFANS